MSRQSESKFSENYLLVSSLSFLALTPIAPLKTMHPILVVVLYQLHYWDACIIPPPCKAQASSRKGCQRGGQSRMLKEGRLKCVLWVWQDS